ncbi:Formylmethionine deformylase [Cynara cardunculus var. scolymus]|uniref:Peptide deformylase n=1 Tax=Cynara cardunculus var. scolymus TaxID=59895 RepID=A0A103YBH0_CYNCS|nr:Formylmethionine deformylase [Cynara cardunculus var. scolymus]
MAVIRRMWQCLSSKPLAGECFRLGRSNPFHHTRIPIAGSRHKPILNPGCPQSKPTINVNFITTSRGFSSPTARTGAGWLMGLGNKKKIIGLPAIVKAGDPVLHEPAREVSIEEIGSDRIQKIIDDMVQVMRKRPGVGLAAPQIGIPLKIIVLEDTKEYIAHVPEEENKAQDRRPFDLLVILNPKLKKKGNKSALFFEGCLRAMVERFLEVEVRGLDRDGKPLKVDACGWQARILQHECDHLDGTLYVDKMVKRTFRTIDNLDLPLANSCPKQGVH